MKTFTIILLLVCLALSGILFKQCSDAREGLAKIAQKEASVILLEEEIAKFDAKFLSERDARIKEQLVADAELKMAEISLSEAFYTMQEAVSASTKEEATTRGGKNRIRSIDNHLSLVSRYGVESECMHEVSVEMQRE